MNKNILISGFVAVVLGLFLWKYLSLNVWGPSDQAMIDRALSESVQASKEGRPGGVMDYLADRLKVNSDEFGSRQVANFIKDSHPDIVIPRSPAVVSGDQARITTPVSVKASYLGFSIDRKIDNVSLIFQRSEAHEWLFIPVKKWRLSQVLVPQDVATW